MKIKRLLAAAAASVVAVSAMAIVVSADSVLECKKTGESGKPEGNVWELPIADEKYTADELAKVEKAVLTVTSTAYVNGAMGGNSVKSAGWAAGPQGENSAAGTSEWVWDGIGGLVKGKGEDGNETGYFKAEIWWQNVNDDGSDSTVTFNKLDLLDASGNVIYTFGAAPAAPSTSSTPENSSSGDNSGSGDNVNTGVEGVAAVVGVAALAGAALVVARKRK